MPRRPRGAAAPDLQQYYALRECAAIANVSERTVRRAINAGDLRAHRIGRSIRVAKTDFTAWIERYPVSGKRT